MMRVIQKFENKEYGIESYVTLGTNGFHVSIKDMDAGEFLPMVNIYKDEKVAISKAKDICK